MSQHACDAHSAHPTTSHIILLRGNTVIHLCYQLIQLQNCQTDIRMTTKTLHFKYRCNYNFIHGLIEITDTMLQVQSHHIVIDNCVLLNGYYKVECE